MLRYWSARSRPRRAEHLGFDATLRAAKLRAMTVENGCTAGEAAAAKEKLRRLEEGSGNLDRD